MSFEIVTHKILSGKEKSFDTSLGNRQKSRQVRAETDNGKTHNRNVIAFAMWRQALIKMTDPIIGTTIMVCGGGGGGG